ncbi:MAG TPA: hypothetical protein VGI40_11400 [Pirellulaceae bacterium]|jgi:hypothetical protein
MTDPAGQLRRIAWDEVFPWLIIFRCFRIAISPSLLALATVAVLISPLGWQLSAKLFLSTEALERQLPHSHLVEALPPAIQSWLPSVTENPFFATYLELAEPLARLFRLEFTLSETAFYFCGLLWTMAIWSFPAGVITRRAIVQLATDEPLGIGSAAMFAGSKYASYFLTPFYPLLGLVLLALPIACLGLVVWLLPGIGAALAGVSWLLVIVAGAAAMWLVGGLMLGFPLMWPTISAERDGDPFEAFSRSYAYVYGKPLHYFFYAIVAALFGALSFIVVLLAVVIVREFGFWALSWGTGGPLAEQLRSDVTRFLEVGEFDSTRSALWKTGATLIALLIYVLQSVSSAFRFSYFFCAASAIYLLLRHDVDEKEMDEVFVEPKITTAPDANP